MMSDYKVETINDGMQEFFVEFNGPKDSMFWFSFFIHILIKDWLMLMIDGRVLQIIHDF